MCIIGLTCLIIGMGAQLVAPMPVISDEEAASNEKMLKALALPALVTRNGKPLLVIRGVHSAALDILSIEDSQRWMISDLSRGHLTMTTSGDQAFCERVLKSLGAVAPTTMAK